MLKTNHNMQIAMNDAIAIYNSLPYLNLFTRVINNMLVLNIHRLGSNIEIMVTLSSNWNPYCRFNVLASVKS